MTCESMGGDCSSTLYLLLIISVVLCLCTVGLFIRLVYHEKRHFVFPRVQIMNLRVAAILPGFSIISLVAFLFPYWMPILEAFEALIEGYCIFCLFKMLVIFVGNTESITNEISNKSIDVNAFSFCQKNSPRKCFRMIQLQMVQFFTLRPILVLIAGLAEMLNWPRQVYLGFTVLYVIALFTAMIALINFYRSIKELTAPLNPLRKFLFVKGYILLIVIQNIIINQVSKGNHAYGPIRVYDFVIIVEVFILSLFSTYIFSFPDESFGIQTSLSQKDQNMKSIIMVGSFMGLLARVMNPFSIIFDRIDQPMSVEMKNLTVDNNGSSSSDLVKQSNESAC